MPSKAPRSCRQPGCPETTKDPAGFCEAHKKKDREKQDRARGSARERGYTRNWEKLRSMYLQHVGGLCEVCRASGRLRPAELVHHKESIRDRPDLRFAWANLEALCRQCHDRAHHGGHSEPTGGGKKV